MWLKRSTPQNIVIGGAAGALAADDRLGGRRPARCRSSRSLLFLIIFFWTPPHFWALALYRADDYARAGVPMLPVVAGDAADAAADPALHADPGAARRRALRCSAMPARSTASTAVVDRRGHAGAGLAGAPRAPRRPSAPASSLFAFSILYLFLLFAVLLVERGWGGLLGRWAT